MLYKLRLILVDVKALWCAETIEPGYSARTQKAWHISEKPLECQNLNERIIKCSKTITVWNRNISQPIIHLGESNTHFDCFLVSILFILFHWTLCCGIWTSFLPSFGIFFFWTKRKRFKHQNIFMWGSRIF